MERGLRPADDTMECLGVKFKRAIWRRPCLPVCAALLISCESVPPGEPPPDGILAEQIHVPANQKNDKTQEEAVSYMLTSIVSSCHPVSTASISDPPSVINDFIASAEGKVNYMPMELWAGLVKMKMLRPVTAQEDARYSLFSEFGDVEERDGRKRMLWRMKMTETGSDVAVWQEKISFTIE